jgi:HlyD family secretion protein
MSKTTTVPKGNPNDGPVTGGNGFSDTSTLATSLAVSGEGMDITRPRKSRVRLIVPLLLVVVVAAIAAWWFLQPAKTADTATVRRGTIISTVETTGKLEADTSASLAFKTGGRVEKINVKQGDTVRAGQVLAQLESTDLERGVQTAQAQLEISKLKLQQAQEGSPPEDITAATADLTSATAQLDSLKKGSRVEDIAAAQAGVDQARAKLDAARKGPTAEDITQAEATLRQAQAKLESAKQPATPEQISQAEAALRGAQAQYDALNAGPTKEDIAVAQAGLDEANASLNKVKAGPSPSDIAAAQAKLDGATAARTNTAALASNTKEQARLSVAQASNALQNVQDIYGTIKDENSQKKPQDLTNDDKNREAKALRDVEDAQSKLDQAQLSYDTAKKTEIAQLAQADASVQEAQAALDKIKAGPTAEDIAVAQAGVDGAWATLDKVKAGPTAQDLAASQASVDQAQSKLDELKAGGTANEIAAAQADVDKTQAALDTVKAGPSAEDVRAAEGALAEAQANLDKVKAGATPDEIKQAQAEVDKVQAALDKVKAGPDDTDLSILQQQIVLSQISVDSANAELDNAQLVSPIDGTVLTTSLDIGEVVSGLQSVMTVANTDSLRVKADIDEIDVGRVSAGQAVTVTLDAYPGVKLPGSIDELAPGATQKQGSTVYQATVSFTVQQGVVPREGMAANVDVTAQRKDNVLLLPNRAFETVGDRHYATVKDGSDTRKVEVETGLSNSTDTEVLTGLQEGQTVEIGK